MNYLRSYFRGQFEFEHTNLAESCEYNCTTVGWMAVQVPNPYLCFYFKLNVLVKPTLMVGLFYFYTLIRICIYLIIYTYQYLCISMRVERRIYATCSSQLTGQPNQTYVKKSELRKIIPEVAGISQGEVKQFESSLWAGSPFETAGNTDVNMRWVHWSLKLWAITTVPEHEPFPARGKTASTISSTEEPTITDEILTSSQKIHPNFLSSTHSFVWLQNSLANFTDKYFSH